jgi:cytochrome c553
VPEAAPVERGAQLATQIRCVSCHLPSLKGQDQTPRLAGQAIDYMVQALKDNRHSAGPGADPLMNNVVAGVSDADLTALARYAASR